MKKVESFDKVYVKKSKIAAAGRGVFAKRDIKKGEVVEKCPMIEIPEYDLSNLTESILVTYFFYFGKNKAAIALGFGSIYNHSYKPNITFKINRKERFIDFVALKNIKKDEELVFNYHHTSKKSKKYPLWFEKK